jgi:hypothetical protein
MNLKNVFLPAAAMLIFGTMARPAAAVTLIDGCRAITVAGSYQLSTDISGKSLDGQACIRIETSKVTLDLGGHVLRGHNNLPYYGIIADGAFEEIKISNGIVADFFTGIELGISFGSVIENVQVNVNHEAMHAGNGAVLLHVQAIQNDYSGITAGAGSFLDDVAVQASGSDGIRVGLGSLVKNSWSEFNSGFGILLDRTYLGATAIFDNTTGSNNKGGISADCAGSVPQAGGGVYSGLDIYGNINDPYFPNHGPHILARVPEVYTYLKEYGVRFLHENCQQLQADAVVHVSGDPE